MDLLGSDLPVESEEGLQFAWSDGILLQVVLYVSSLNICSSVSNSVYSTSTIIGRDPGGVWGGVKVYIPLPLREDVRELLLE